MHLPATIDLKHRLRRLTAILRRNWARRRLTRDLAYFTNKDLTDVLTQAGIRRSELFTGFKGNLLHRRLMGRMLERFGIDRETACEHHWRKLVHAERTCAGCPNSGRCQRWLAWGRRNNAPNVFCPNAGLFTQIRRDLDLLTRVRPRTYANRGGPTASQAMAVGSAWGTLRQLEQEPFWRRGPGS